MLKFINIKLQPWKIKLADCIFGQGRNTINQNIRPNGGRSSPRLQLNLFHPAHLNKTKGPPTNPITQANHTAATQSPIDHKTTILHHQP